MDLLLVFSMTMMIVGTIAYRRERCRRNRLLEPDRWEYLFFEFSVLVASWMVIDRNYGREESATAVICCLYCTMAHGFYRGLWLITEGVRLAIKNNRSRP